MTSASASLGELTDLAIAIGLAKPDGSFNADWLTRPGDYLGEVLADDDQREALLDFAATALAGELPAADTDGRRWLPVVEVDEPDKPLVRIFVVIDERAADFVALGVGARLEVASPRLTLEVHVPLFRGQRGSGSVPDNIYIGEPGADITLKLDLQLDSGTSSGGARVGGLNVSARVPTDGSTPQLLIGLRGLQLPGDSAPRDITLDPADPAALTATLRDLVFSLAQLGADDLTGSTKSIAGMLGLLNTDGLPALPLAEFSTNGVGALASWLDRLLADPGTRALWISHFAGLFGTVAVQDSAVFAVNGARVSVSVRRRPGATGSGQIVVTAGVALDAGPTADPGVVALSALADLFAIDVGGPAITLLPSATAQVRIGPPDPGTLIAAGGTPSVAVGAFRIGFEIATGRPASVVLAADRVKIDGKGYETVDLTNPGAVAEVVAGASAGLVEDLLDELGAAGGTLARIIGLPGTPSTCKIDPIAFVANPVDALAKRWECLLGQPDDIKALLGDLQSLITTAGAITGDGSPPGVGQGPWRVPLAGPVRLDIWRNAGTLFVTLSTSHSIDTLGQRCTVVETDLRATLAEIDFAGRSARFVTGFDGNVRIRGRGTDRTVIPLGPFTFESAPIAFHFGWTPSGGLAADVDVRDTKLHWEERRVFDFPIPKIAVDGSVTLPAEGWRALEPVIGALALQHPEPWIADLVRLFGWVPGQSTSSVLRLGLDELVLDARGALTEWLARIALDDLKLLPRVLDLLAWVFTGTIEAPGGLLSGLGVASDPLLLPINSHPRSPALAVWVDAPSATTARVAVSPDVQIWRPGNRGFAPASLAAAIAAEAEVDVEIADLLRGRVDVAEGLEALAARWESSDGIVIPPPEEDTIHIVGSIDHRALADVAVSLVPDLGGFTGLPPVVVCVAIGPVSESPFTPEPGDVIVDLSAPGLAAGAFSYPTAAAGRWMVALPSRADAMISGDSLASEGVKRQAERLGRLLDHLATLGQPIAIVAHGGAGHAAQVAASTRPAFALLVTAGTPIADVPLTALDTAPSGDALRLLAALLPAPKAEPDDDDLALGRRLITGMLSLARRADPAGDLRAPTPQPVSGPTPVHRIFGSLDMETIERAMTAVVFTGLARRAQQRADGEQEPAKAAWIGVRLPVPDIGDPTDVTAVSGWLQLDLVRAGRAGDSVEIAKRPHLRTHVEIGRRDGGWLVGGPDPTRGTAAPPSLELRRLHVDSVIPLPGAGTVGDTAEVDAELVLHEARAFGMDRPRWKVNPQATTGSAVPLLPEVRAVLSAAASGWAAATDTTGVNLRAFLGSIGVMASDGHLPDAVDHLLQDPDRFTDELVSAAESRSKVVTAAANLFGSGATATDSVLRWTADTAAITADLAAGTLDIEVGATTGDIVALGVHGRFHYGPVADVDIDASAGATGKLAFATDPFRVTIADPFTDARINLWPLEVDAGAMLAKLVARFVPSEMARLALDGLRRLDVDAQPTVDAMLDAFGLLAPPDINGFRVVASPGRLLHDPGRWLVGVLGTAGRVEVARLEALLAAIRPIIGIDGSGGTWSPATGVSLAATTDTSGRAALRVSIDTSAFAAPAGARLWAKVASTLAFGDGAPTASLSAEIGSGTSGSIALNVTPGTILELRPTSRPAIRLYPDPAGLGDLLTNAIAAGAPSALATVLDRIAARASATGLEGDTGKLVVGVGDALALRVSGKFDPAKLDDLARHPGQYLSDRAASLVDALAARIPPLLSLPPAQLGIGATGGTLTVRVRDLTLSLQPTPLLISVQGNLTGLPGLEAFSVSVAAGATALEEFIVEAGPLALSVGGAELRPYFRAAPRVKSGGEPRRVELGLALDATATRRLAGRWLLDPGTFELVVVDGTAVSTAAAELAAAAVEATAVLVAAVVLAVDKVDDALDNNHVGSRTIRQILSGVVLTDSGTDVASGLADPARLLGRLGRLAKNLAGAAPPVQIDGTLTVAFAVSGDRIGVRLGLAEGTRYPLVDGEITLSLETDASWIDLNGGGAPPAGVEVFVAEVASSGSVTFTPSLSVNGIGIRVGRDSAPLLDLGVRIDSVALHVYADIAAAKKSGGVQLQLAGLGAPLSGASGGTNAIASGILSDARSDASNPPPKFSPSLSVQRHGTGSVKIGLRAGPGGGPWWVAVQRALGPVYVEQVGFGVSVDQDELQSISLLVDGRVTLFGLTAAVDDLRVTYFVAANASLFDPASWAVDLAGLALSGELSGLTVSGGLVKYGSGNDLQYLGALMVHMGPYGLSVFGGYAKQGDLVSLFAFGALNAPIGGPPAFFVTGIGGGLGINRSIVFPQELSAFGSFPFIKALDPAAAPSPDPMAELRAMGDIFPVARGSFWFAAGLSFTSFALVDGILVVSVEIGDGLEIAILGLARVALPRPQLALVSIELGLIARMSTREGTLLVMGALTDNSWLLVRDVRLTGGFAFATWWKGPNRGHAVVTLGGYHPNFHRDGYPEVPRLGLSVQLGPVAIRAGAYFALTSEAIMAGGRFEASLDIGWAGANLVFEANGIVFFDPFQYDVELRARVSAWADVGFFDVSVSKTVGLHVMGPKFHGTANIPIGPTSIDVDFGDWTKPETAFIAWDAFVEKYLEVAAPGVPRALSALTGAGSLPASTSEAGSRNTPDGQTIPYRVYAEFEARITTSLPARSVAGLRGSSASDHVETRNPSGSDIGIAPVGRANVPSTVKVRLFDSGGHDRMGQLGWDVLFGGGYPIGVWGAPQDRDHPAVPSGVVIDAITGVEIKAVASIPAGTAPIAYHQVEIGTRLPNPLASEAVARAAFRTDAGDTTALVAGVTDTYAAADAWLARAGASRALRSSLRGERAAPPRVGTLTDSLAQVTPAGAKEIAPAVVPPGADHSVHRPFVRAILTPSVRAGEVARLRTTVRNRGDAEVADLPTLAGVREALGNSAAARLTTVTTRGVATRTVMSVGAVPATRTWRAGVAAIAGRGEAGDGAMRRRSVTSSIAGNGHDRGIADLSAGEVIVLELPNAQNDVHDEGRPALLVRGGATQVVSLAPGGTVLANDRHQEGGNFRIPRGTARIAVVTGNGVEPGRSMVGWHSGQEVAYVGWSTVVVPGATVRFEGAHIARRPQRFAAAWIGIDELSADAGSVETAFTSAATVIAVVIDGAGAPSDAERLGIGVSSARLTSRECVAVVAGDRTTLFFEIAAEGAFTVTVAPPSPWRVAGVLASSQTLEDTVAEVARRGIDDVLPATSLNQPGRWRLAWEDGAGPLEPIDHR